MKLEFELKTVFIKDEIKRGGILIVTRIKKIKKKKSNYRWGCVVEQGIMYLQILCVEFPI